MGTRHLQMVISKEGDLKIRQYGQWDGYPEGQGLNILRYLRSGNLEKYHENLCKIREATHTEISEMDKNANWQTVYPHMSRDCGSKIHQLIEDGKVPSVIFLAESEDYWCEGFYTIDFQNNTFTTDYYDIHLVYSLDNLPTEDEYLKAAKTEEDI